MRSDIAPGGTFSDYELPNHEKELRQDLRAVTAEIRPDWDLSTTALREAWETGDLSPFHGSVEKAGADPSAA